MELLPPDTHAYLAQHHAPGDLQNSGAVLAMALSLDEAALAVHQQDATIAWGVGCHPRIPKAQNAFDIIRFGELAAKTAIVGEIGLDSGSRVPPGRILVESDHGYNDPPAAIPCRIEWV